MTSTSKYKKKLVDVAMPLEAVNAAAAREPSIRPEVDDWVYGPESSLPAMAEAQASSTYELPDMSRDRADRASPSLEAAI